MENYFGSQQHWEDNINADYDESERHEQEDTRTQQDDRKQPRPSHNECDSPYHNVQVEQDGRCHCCESDKLKKQ
jgi:hypothetical protein